MGPRARARGNSGQGRPQTDIPLLQWGHERALVEIRARYLTISHERKLQWGHERALVEIYAV